MGRRRGWRRAHGVVSNITNRLRHGTESWRGLDPSPGASKRDADKLRLIIITRKDDGRSQTVLGIQEEAIEPILDASFGDADRAKLGIRMTHLEEESVQSKSKLHGFRRRVWNGGVIDRWPAPLPGVVAEKLGLAIAFVLDGSRGEHELR